MSLADGILVLVLTFDWYDKTVLGGYEHSETGFKRIEYREQSEKWLRDIMDKAAGYDFVRFSRGYTDTTATFRITKIDYGDCPIAGIDGRKIRIHFEDLGWFPEAVGFSPFHKWKRERRIATYKSPNLDDGEQPWSAWFGNYDPMDFAEVATNGFEGMGMGETEDEALLELIRKHPKLGSWEELGATS